MRGLDPRIQALPACGQLLCLDTRVKPAYDLVTSVQPHNSRVGG